MRKIFTSVKLIIPILLIFSFCVDIQTQTLPDSLIYNTYDIDIGEPFYTSTANYTSFGHWTINSFIEDPVDGYLHVAYVDNYELYYYKSTDEGQTWQKEQIITGHEGDIRNASLAVDLDGKIFIGMTIHPDYNYSNPTGVIYWHEFEYDLYCVHNKIGSWSVELIATHTTLNNGPVIENVLVDANNDVHLFANKYGWYNYGGEAWEWIRYSSSDTWSSRTTIVEFTDAGIDRGIYDKYIILADTSGKLCLVAARNHPDGMKLFYILNNGSGWETPVELSDNIAVTWNRFDAVLDPEYNSYIAYLYNNTSGLPELKVSRDFETPLTANINLPVTDTLNYFTLHCNTFGRFTMYLWIKNKNVHVTFSDDCLNWSDPIEIPDDLTNYFGGLMVRTDTRQGYFTNLARQIVAIAGTRAALPYGPDTLFYGDIRYYSLPATPELIAPPNSTVIDTTSVEFNWTESYPAIEGYWFEIADNDQFNSSFIDSTLTDPTFIYDNILPNKTYYWKTKCKNFRGWGDFSETWSFSTVLVSVDDNKIVPTRFLLDQNFPNPFNPTTQISFSLPEQSFVELKVYNILGIEVANIISKELPAGSYTENFNASNLSSGIYFYKLNAGKYSDVKKMTLIK